MKDNLLKTTSRFAFAAWLLCLSTAIAGSPSSNPSDKAYEPGDKAKQEVEIGGAKASTVGILAKLKDPEKGNVGAFAATMQKTNLKVGRNFKLVPGLQRLVAKPGAALQAEGGNSVEATIKKLRETGLFEYVEPDWIVHVLQTPTDSAFTDGGLWGLSNTGQKGGTAGVDVNAVPAWEITTGSPSVVVGVIDTGIRHTHQDLAGNMWVNTGEIPGNGIDDDNNGYIDDVHGINAITGSGDPFDDNNHGSHCAGTIAATAFDDGQHVGVAYDVRLMGLKFLGDNGNGNISDAITCIEYAIQQDVDILNNSWGGGGFSQALLDAIEAANDAGILFVAAAGNSASNNDLGDNYPSNYDVPNVIAVAAIDRTGALASFSSYGASTVDIGAPGVAILSSTADSDTSYAEFRGTSMATPHVAGVAALMASQYPGIGILEMRSRLIHSAAPLPSLSGKVASGGMVDAHAALTLAEDGSLKLLASSNGVLLTGRSTDFYIMVSDLLPVTGATVSANFDGAAPVAFLDDGIAPDVTANDGIYSASLLVPTDSPNANLNAQVSAPGMNPASEVFPFDVSFPPENDNFADRIDLAIGTTQTTGSNLLATSEDGEPINPPVAGGHTAWWSWTAETNGSVIISTLGSNYDTTLAIYQGASLGELSLIGANDDSYRLQSAVTFIASAGETYQIQVDGWSDRQGDIQLNFSDRAPDNDDFADATVLSAGSGTFNGYNNRASGEASEPNHADVSEPLASVWYLWRAPFDGSLTVDTFGSDFDTTLAAYTGGSIDSLTMVAANNDAGGLQSQITFNVVAGTVYPIAVDGHGSSEGNIALTLDFTPDGPPPGEQTALYFEDDNSGSNHALTALRNLGYTVTVVDAATETLPEDLTYFNLMVIEVYGSAISSTEETAIAGFISDGKPAIINYWNLNNSPTLQAAFQVRVSESITAPETLNLWEPADPIFAGVGDPLTPIGDNGSGANGSNDNGDKLNPAVRRATALAGYADNSTAGQAAIIRANGGRTIANGFAAADFNGTEMVSLFENEINSIDPRIVALYFSQDDNLRGLYQIDTETGAVTQIGRTGVTGANVGLAPSNDPELLYGSLFAGLVGIRTDGSREEVRGGANIEGLAYDVRRYALYGAINGAFFRVDQTTGNSTISLAAPGFDAEGLAHDGADTIYATGSWTYGSGADNTFLHAYDITSNSWSAVFDLGIVLDRSGLAYDPGSGMLYAKASDDTNLYRIDPIAQTIETVGNTGIRAGGGLAFVGASVDRNRVNQAPFADTTGNLRVVDTDFDGSENVTLDGSSSIDRDGRIVSWEWTWDGGSASGETAKGTFPLGTTSITLTVTDDFGATGTATLEITVAPAPSPLTFAIAPTAVDATTVGMVATPVSDVSGPVEYFFENTTNGNTSGWITDTRWDDTGLAAGSYDYRAKARDALGNEGDWSATLSASPGADVTAPSPNPMSFEAPPTALGEASISLTATTASDINGVEYYFENIAGGGPDSLWQSGTTFTATGLNPDTEYSYVVRARDSAGNITANSAPASATTDAPDTTPPSPDPMTFAVSPTALGETEITMTATTATDESGVEYYFEAVTGGGSDSGWQASPEYTDTMLAPATEYSYRVRARDKSPAQNATAFSAALAATTDTPDTAPPTPDPMTFASPPATLGASAISMSATTATDESDVEYFFQATDGGNDSGWQDSPDYTDTGLVPETTYSYRVQARDKSPAQNTTGWSATASAATGSVFSVAVTNSKTVQGARTGNGDNVSITEPGWSLTGGNAVAVYFTAENGQSFTASFGGQPMTVVEIFDGDRFHAGIAYLIDPNVTEGDVVIDATNSGSDRLSHAYSILSLSGVGSAAAIDSRTSNGDLGYTTATEGGYVLAAALNNSYNGSTLPAVSGNPSVTMLQAAVDGNASMLHTHGAVPTAGSYTDSYSGSIEAAATVAFNSGGGSGGSPFGDWADTYPGLTDTTSGLDFDSGGLATALEWVLGGDPTNPSDDTGLVPTFDATSDPDGKLLFIFRRDADAEADPDTTIIVEYGSDLSGWTTATHQGTGPGDITISEVTDGFGAGIDRVTVALPPSVTAEDKLFVRLSAGVNTP